MELKVQAPFEQLLTIVKTLTPTEKARLRQELDEKTIGEKDKEEFIGLLLNGPVYADRDIKIIEENRKSIAKWRTRS